MPIDYRAESEKYRPEIIKTLLVGEAPPPSGESYFYVPKMLKLGVTLENERGLPATIFGHYFGKRPESIDEYALFLTHLQRAGIFLVDICDDPIKVRDNPDGEKRIVREIRTLRKRLAARKIQIPDEKITFLLARKSYLSHIKLEFPMSRYIPWIEFRINSRGDLIELE